MRDSLKSTSWSEYQLDEITELISDCPHSTPKWKDNGVIVLRSQNIKNGRLDLTSPSFTDEAGYLGRVKRAIPEFGDLVLTREAPMGEVCQIPEGIKCCLGQRMVLLRPDKTKIDSRYLLYAIQSPYLQHQISWNEGTGTTVSNIRMPNIKAFNIPTPELKEQKAIAHIFGSLDDKIELNRQMNTTLEAMAQALFKSWFVDFDPVIDNALAAGNPIPDALQDKAAARAALGDARKPLPEDVAGLFPAAFVWTEEMGWIPEGWEVENLSSIAAFSNGKSSPDRMNGEIPVFGSNGKIGYCNESNKENVIIIGRVGTYCGSLHYHNSKCWVTDNAMSAEMKGKQDNLFLLELLKISSLNDLRTGSGQPLLNQGIIKSIKFACPPMTIIKRFSTFSSENYGKNIQLEKQSATLSQLRDVLLPKLLSGELRISDAEKLIEEAGV